MIRCGVQLERGLGFGDSRNGVMAMGCMDNIWYMPPEKNKSNLAVSFLFEYEHLKFARDPCVLQRFECPIAEVLMLYPLVVKHCHGKLPM